MSVGVFQRDLRLAQRELEAEKRREFWIRLFTLGLFDNRPRVVAADQRLKQCRAELISYESLLMEAQALDDLLVRTIVLDGVRVSKHIFADVPVLGAADYGIDWGQIRDLVLARDDYECQEADGYCRGPLQIHHIVPLSRGGANDLDNLVTLCFYHHCLKHDHMKAKYDGSVWC